MPPVNENLLMQYVAYCFNNLHLSHSTIKLYLTGIKFKYIVAGVPSPFCGEGGTGPGEQLIRLQMVLKGVQRSSISKPRTRLPITRDMIQNICSRLRQGVFSKFLDTMLETVCVVAFYAFLRCGEFTCSSKFDPSSNLSIGDIALLEDHAILTLNNPRQTLSGKGLLLSCFVSDLPFVPAATFTTT